MKGREVLIAVTGGIAAYKTAALVSQLTQAGAGVSVIMTRSATKLVAPKTFEALSGRPVGTAVFGRGAHPHIEAARQAEVLVRGPRHGQYHRQGGPGVGRRDREHGDAGLRRADHRGPRHELCRCGASRPCERNIAQLRADGMVIIDPETGHLSCGEVGAGRMAEPEVIFNVIAEQLAEDRGKSE